MRIDWLGAGGFNGVLALSVLVVVGALRWVFG
jgi:hypothetical protein